MSTLYLLIKTFLVGFALAAPVGPIGLLTIRISLAEGMLAGYAAGIGVALADAAYASIAVFGLAALSTFILVFRSFFIIAGGCYLIYMGIGFLRRPTVGVKTPCALSETSLFSTTVSMFFLTLANPVTLITLFGIFAAIEVPAGLLPQSTAVLGMFLGSVTWWLTLATLVAITKRHLPDNFVTWVNRISGIIIVIFGLLAIALELYHL
ncbi:MAG: LysE family translocator [Patescibacteria group bacterium]|nr:LysE family translocator [Patescibacteria group bacterium]